MRVTEQQIIRFHAHVSTNHNGFSHEWVGTVCDDCEEERSHDHVPWSVQYDEDDVYYRLSTYLCTYIMCKSTDRHLQSTFARNEW